MVRIGYLPLERFPRLRAVLDEVGRASTIETTIIAVSWSSWWSSAVDLVAVAADFVVAVVGGIGFVGEVELPICQVNCLEAELEGRYSEPTDTLATVKLQVL
jgi:hypothetical protein